MDLFGSHKIDLCRLSQHNCSTETTGLCHFCGMDQVEYEQWNEWSLLYIMCTLTRDAMGVTSTHVVHQYARTTPLNRIFI